MTRPRVFLPIRPHQDVSGAEAFGDIVVLLSAETFSPFQVELVERILMSELRRHGFDPSRDFIADAGPRLFSLQLFGHALAEYGIVRTLMFDARGGGRYVDRTIQSARHSNGKAHA